MIPEVTNNQQTQDSLFNGNLICKQYKEGYRFSIDAILAAHFLTPVRKGRILDAGTGCGIIPLILMYRWKDRIQQIDGLELQPRLTKLASENFLINHFSDKCRVIEGDIKSVLQYVSPEYYDHVICNPPFYKSQSGRQSHNMEARNARHQVNGGISEFVRGCSSVLKNRGTAVFVYPAELSNELILALNASRLEPKRIRYVYSFADSTEDGVLVLMESRKNGGPGVQVLAPLYIYESRNGSYSQEMAEMYEP